MRVFQALAASGILALAACGDLSGDIERAKQGALEAGEEALSAGMEQVDTRTACLLAGQSEAFCGCLSERLGDNLTPEQVGALAEAIRSTVSGQPADTAAEPSEDMNAHTREALIQCTVASGIESATSESGAN